MTTDKKYIEIPKLFFSKFSEIIERNRHLYTDIISDFALFQTEIDFNNVEEDFTIRTWKDHYEFDGAKLITFTSPIIEIFKFKLDGFLLSREELIINETVEEIYPRCTIVTLSIKPIKREELFDETIMKDITLI